LALASLLALFFFWQVNHLEGFSWDYDEGVFLVSAWEVDSGYRLYSEVFFAQPPGFISSIAWAFRLGGISVATGRALMVLYATIGLLAVALMARELGGSLAGLAAVALLAITPDFFLWSKAVMADLPSASLAALAMALAFYYLRSRERRWLVLSGLALSASLLIKLYAFPAFIPIALLVFWRLSRGDVPQSRMDFVKEIGLLAASIALPVLFCLLIYDPQYLYDQMLAFPLQAKKAFPLNVASNWQAIWNYLDENYGLLSLATFGGLLLLAKRRAGGMIIIIWLILATVGLLTHSPLWPRHHLIVLLLPSAVLGGVAIGDVWDRLRRLAAPIASQRMLPLLMGLCAVAFYSSALPATLKRDVGLSVGPQTEIGEEAVRFISAVTNPNDFVITDEQMIAFRARRRVPPLLCDTSFKRIQSEYLTANQLIEVSKKYDAQVVLLWSDRLAKLPGYVRWVKANYHLVKSYGARHQIYQKGQHPMKAQHPMQINLGDKITFLGYDLRETEVEPGGTLYLTLYWQARAKMDTSYTVFTHLIDAQGYIGAQKDNLPCSGEAPTTGWLEGEVIVDEYEILVRPDTPPGKYRIEVGMYLLESMKRLAAVDEDRGRLSEDRVLLEPTIIVGD